MAHFDDQHNITTPSKNIKDFKDLDNTLDVLTRVYARGPGFIVWVRRPNSRSGGFITWSETAVAELSPAIADAWSFPTSTAANDAVSRAFGPAAEDFLTAVFPDVR